MARIIRPRIIKTNKPAKRLSIPRPARERLRKHNLAHGSRQRWKEDQVITTTTTTSTTTAPSTPTVFFETEGSQFRGVIQVNGTPSIQWDFTDGGQPTTADPGLQDFGSTGNRSHSVECDPGTDLDRIDFDEGNIDTIISSITGLQNGFDNLDRIYCSGYDEWNHGQITTINVTGLSNLTRLYLDDNALSSITGISDLTSLVRLYLRGNALSAFDPNDIGNASLTHLRMSWQTAHPASLDLSKFGVSLIDLRFGGNGNPTSLPSLSAFTSIETLEIVDTGLASITFPDIFGSSLILGVRIGSNASLTAINFDASNDFSTWGGGLYINGNALTQANLDTIIQDAYDDGMTKELAFYRTGECSEAKYERFTILAGRTGQPPMGDEALTGYTEVDPNSRIVVNSDTKITVAGMTRNEDAYVYTDLTADNVNSHFTCLVKIKNITGSSGRVCIFALGQSVNDVNGMEAADEQVISVWVENVDASNFRIVLRTNGTDVTLDENVGASIDRSTYGGSDGIEIWLHYHNAIDSAIIDKLEVTVYNKSNKSTYLPQINFNPLHSSLSSPARVNVDTFRWFRYLYAINSFNDAGGGSIGLELEEFQFKRFNNPVQLPRTGSHTENDTDGVLTRPFDDQWSVNIPASATVASWAYYDFGTSAFKDDETHFTARLFQGAAQQGTTRIYFGLFVNATTNPISETDYLRAYAEYNPDTDTLTYGLESADGVACDNTDTGQETSITPTITRYISFRIIPATNTVTLKIFSNNLYTTLVDTLTVTLCKFDYRYFHPIAVPSTTATEQASWAVGNMRGLGSRRYPL